MACENRYIVMGMGSAISDLRCYIIMYLQHLGREQEAVQPDSLTTTLLANFLFP